MGGGGGGGKRKGVRVCVCVRVWLCVNVNVKVDADGDVNVNVKEEGDGNDRKRERGIRRENQKMVRPSMSTWTRRGTKVEVSRYPGIPYGIAPTSAGKSRDLLRPETGKTHSQ